MPDTETPLRPPRDNLFRGMSPGDELRAEAGDEDMPTLRGHFAVFNEWTEINSLFEGNFMERFAPGAFDKTIAEQRDAIRVLFQHGHDPVIGDKPLGAIEALSTDSKGVAYEVPLLDTSYNRELLPGLKADLYGASFRFRVMREEIADAPETSDFNPQGIPERTVKEAQVFEFGPVTFPAYDSATAGVRSMTDQCILEQFAADPERFAQLLDNFRAARDEHPERQEGDAEEIPSPRQVRIPLSRRTTLERSPEWRLP